MRTTVSEPRGTLSDMDREERRHKVSAYVRERLAAECAVRGGAARISRSTGFTTAHISKVKNGAGVGDDFIRAMAKHWKTDAATIEAEALKRPASVRPSGPQASTAREAVRASSEYASASDAVRTEFDSLSSDAPMSVVGWARELDRLIEMERRGWLPVRPQSATDGSKRGGKPKP